MRLKHFLSVFLTLLTLSVGQVWGAKQTITLNFYDDSKISSTSGTNASVTYIRDHASFSDNTLDAEDVITAYSATGQVQYGKNGGLTFGANSTAAANCTITFSSDFDFYKVVIVGTNYETNNFTVNGDNGTGSLNAKGTTLANCTSSLVYEKSAGSEYSDALTFAKTATKRGTIYTITLYYDDGEDDTPSYTIEAESNNTTYGTVSLSGSTITGNPESGCRYASPAYSVSPANSATVSQSGNTFTVTPSANTTVTINFEAIPKHTLNYHDGSGDGSKTNVYEGTNLISALGTPAASCDATSTTFVGWTTTEIASKTDTKPTFVAADAVVNSITAAATYYAVYAKSVRKNTTTTYERLTNKSQITNGLNVILIQGSNNALNTTFSRTQLSSGTTLTNPAAGVKWIAEISGTKFKFKNSSGNYIGTANTSNGTAISSNGTYQEWDIITEKGSYSGAWGLNNGNDLEYYSSAFKVYAWSSKFQSSYPWYIYIPQTTYEDYMTTCCTELGSINGSVSWSNSTTAVVEWDKLDDKVSAWALSWSPNTDGSSITSAIADKGETQKTATVSGLACGTDYTFTLTPTIKSGVCTVETNPTIVSSYTKPTITLDKVGTTNGDFSISGNLTSQCPGEDVTVVLAPNSGYEVDALTVGGNDVTSSVSNNSYTFEMPSSNVTIHATFKTSVKPEVNVTATEGLTGTTLSYGNVAKETDKALTITVTGSNLTNDVTWALADTDDESAGMFSISPSSTTIGQSAATSGHALEITFTPAAAKTYTATLTFSTTGAAANKVITLTGTGKNLYTVTFKRDGQVYDTKQAFDGETVTFPENDPEKFDNDYPNFIGWADAISGVANSAPTLKSASDAITANAEYHAVFANAPQPVNSYEKVTTTGDLANNCKYVIAAWDADESKYYAATGSLTSNGYNLDKENITSKVSNNIVTAPANSEVWKATVADSKVQFQNVGNSKYMSAVVNNTHTNFTLTDNSGEEYTYSVSTGAWTFTTSSLTNNKQIEYYDDSGKDYFSYYTAQDAPIYLFKQQSASTEWVTKQIVKHTISYNKNTTDEVTGSLPANATIVDGEDYTVSDAVLSRAGYNFIGWNTSNTATTAQTTIVNVKTNATLYAVWEAIPTYNIEFSVNGAKVEALKLADQLEGTAIVFPDAAAITAASAFPTTGKKFVGWIEASSYASDDAPTFVTSATATADKVYYAVFADQVSEGGYNKLTSTAGLAAGDKLVATDGEAVGMKAWESGKNNCQGTAITIEADRITERGEAAELLLGGESGHWTLFDGENYLYAAGTAGSGTNYMKGKTPKDNACEWTISISSGDATIQSVTNTNTPYMRYNPNTSNNNPLFSCYNSSTAQNAVVLFKKSANIYEDYVTNIAPLDHIAITTAPTKTVYKKGEELDLTGMVVKATYGTGVGAREKTLASDKYTVDLAETALAPENTEFTVSYTENAVAKTATQAIKVFALDKIEITAAPTTTTYLEGATFDKTGMVVEATWGTGEDKIVETLNAEDYTVTPSVLDATSIKSVTISCTHEGVTKTTTQAVTVNERPSLTMSWKVGNADPTETKIYEEGGKYLLALPAEDPDPVDAGFTSDFVFKGWTADATIAKSGENINFAEAGDEMSSATTFHAVFALKNGEDAPAGYRLVNAAPEAGETVILSRKVNDTYYAFTNSAGSSEMTLTNGIVSSSTSSILWDAKAQCGTTDATGVFLFVNNGTNLIHVNSTSFNITTGKENGDIVFTANGDGSFTAARAANDRWFSASGTNGFGVTSNSSSAVALYIFKYAAATTATYSNFRFAPSNVVAPVIDLEAGTYYGAQEVSITAEKAIYYTLDGTNPDKNSIAYSSAISLNEAGTKTVKAVAYDSESDDYSAIVSAEYTIVTEIAAPTMPATGKFYEDSKEVTIEHALTAEGAKIYYSYDNAAYSEYSGALTITETKTVWAYATIGSLTSEKVSATYTKGETVTYTKLTSADQLAAGMEFLIVAATSKVAGKPNTTASNPYLAYEEITPSENTLAIKDEAVQVFLLDREPGAWSFGIDDGKFLVPSSGNIGVSATSSGEWSIAIADGGAPTITCTGNSDNNTFLWNKNSPRFKTYKEINTQIDALENLYYLPYDAAYTLTYDVDGTENDKTVKVVEGYEYTIVNDVFGDASEGGIDAYWKDANNNLYTVGDKIILTSNMTLTPVWSQVVRSSLAEGKMGTICPKQEVKYPTGASFYELTYKTIENGVPYKVFFDEIAEGASLVAGKPYLFVADGESITGVKVGDEATEGVNDYNGFHGILNPAHTTLSVTADDAANYKYYIITNNEIRLCGAGTFTIPVERAYIDMSALSAEQVAQSPGRRRVCLTNRAAETVTGVEELNASEAPVKVMIDGLLFIIRGEKMYNANGQVVK